VRVVLDPEAVEEIAEAAGWYRGQGPGLEEGLLQEVDDLLLVLGFQPRRFAKILDGPPDLELRRAVLSRFPYGFVFLVMEGGQEVRVVAFAHRRQRPGYWLDRVEEG
jgi:hypothetical protein